MFDEDPNTNKHAKLNAKTGVNAAAGPGIFFGQALFKNPGMDGFRCWCINLVNENLRSHGQITHENH